MMRLRPSPTGSLTFDGARRTPRNQEDMRHPQSIWTELDNADYPLPELRAAYKTHLSSRSKPVAPGTIATYSRRLESFEASLSLVDHDTEPQRLGDPLVLASVTIENVERWLTDMRRGRIGQGRHTEETIANSLSALKTFTRKYVYRHLDMSRRDLLDRVERFEPPVRVEERFSRDELERILSWNEESDKYTDVRDRALMAVYAASGLRYAEAINLDVDDVDRFSGRVRATQKHQRGKGHTDVREVVIGERALKALRAYLRVRRAKDGVDALFTTDEGRPLSYWGGQMLFRRFKAKCGVANFHAHRFRHTVVQHALEKGAERALVQDMMGWRSDQMVRRYGGFVRSKMAARAMPKYAPI
jgi:site-specific recombinase XerD